MVIAVSDGACKLDSIERTNSALYDTIEIICTDFRACIGYLF